MDNHQTHVDQLSERDGLAKKGAKGSEMEMSQIGEQSRLVEEPELYVRPCDVPDCENEAMHRCETRILFKKHGCGAVVCEEHKSKTKLCACLD